MKWVTRVVLAVALVTGFVWVAWQAGNAVAWQDGDDCGRPVGQGLRILGCP